MKHRRIAASAVVVACLTATVALAGHPAKIIDEGRLAQNGVTSDSKFQPPGFPASLAAKGDNVCVTIGYRINADGSTSDFGVLKSWSNTSEDKRPDGSYWNDVINVSATTVSEWKFRSANGDVLVPSYTAATFSFRGNDPIDPSQLRAKCLITDLTAFVQDIKGKRYRSGQPDTFAMEQARRQMQGQRNMVSNPGAGRAATP